MKIRGSIFKVRQGKFSEVDFKKLKNTKDLYRLRVDWIRIILRKVGGDFGVVKIDARKDVYKNL
ncbi:MAG: hypothetical protein WC269_02405 [Candidatus Gracilibacteria bacterium]